MTGQPRALLIHGMAANADTWWRVSGSLRDLGWSVETPNLLGHGGRALGTAATSQDLAEDVWRQHPSGVDLVVGHSLGAYVALDLVTAHPDFARMLVLEDPPSMSASVSADDHAAAIIEGVRRAHADPAGAQATLLQANPAWDSRDAAAVVAGRLQIDPAVAGLSGAGAAGDLVSLVKAAPIPVALLAAVGDDSRLSDPARTALLENLPPSLRAELASGHAVHRDRPQEWIDLVTRLGTSLVRAR